MSLDGRPESWATGRALRRSSCREFVANGADRPGRFAVGDCVVEARERDRARGPILTLANRALRTLPTAFPSLRAHELNPAGHGIRRDLGRRIKFLLLPAIRNFSLVSQELNLSIVRPAIPPEAFAAVSEAQQLLKLPSVYKPAHAHVHRNA